MSKLSSCICTLAVLLFFATQISAYDLSAGVCLPGPQEYNGISDFSVLNHLPITGPLKSNCGYLAMNAMKVCNSPGNSPSGACNQVECCTAMCNLNGAGCFCGRGDGIAELFWGPSSLPISGNMVKLIGALQNTSCPLGTVFSRGLNNCPKGNWESAVESNTAQCKTSTPSPESDACSTKLSTQRSANLLQMLRLINVANGTAPSLSVATASLKKIFTAKGQMMNRLSAIKTGPESVANNIIKPKLKILTGSTAVQSSIKLQMSKLSTSGRSISTTFTIKANDLYGVSHTFGPFNAFAVFSNCSSSIESLYVSNILTSFNTKTLVTPVFQRKPAPTTAPTTRKLLQTPSSISQSTLNTWFLQTVNYIYQLPAVQAITFQFTSGCAESTIGNMQFCSAASITGVLDLDTLGALTTVCGEILCADGAWDTIADWTCSAGCAAACAGCEACDEILLGICGSCSDVCGQTCSCNAECAVSCEESLGSIAVDYTIGDAYFKGLQTLDFTEIQSEGSSYTTGTSTNTTQITDGKPTGLVVTTPISNLQYSLNAAGSFDGFSTSIVFSASSSPNPYNVPALSGSIPISAPTTVINVPSSNWTLSHACTMDYVTTVSYPAGTVTGQNVSNIQGSGALTISLANITIVGDWISEDAIYNFLQGLNSWNPWYSSTLDTDISSSLSTSGNTMINNVVSPLLNDLLQLALKNIAIGTLPCCVYADPPCSATLPYPPTYTATG